MLKITTEITPHLYVEELKNDASKVRLLLSKLLGKLAIHLAMEDQSLYPQMLDHTDERVKEMARKFMDEMGGLGEAVNAYRNKWPSDLPIQEEPAEFIAQTNEIFMALANRIERENRELYKMVDEL
ncbi:MAG: hypothetical protein GY781_20415 [Gammaproteobacteria bacterium]|nr:hypothetical protein [Gammaproteobacteria bacterium]